MDESIAKLQNLDEQIESRVQAIRAERDWWLCRRGCDHCCRHLAHPPELSLAEWERVDRAVAHLPNSVQVEINHRIDALLQQIVQQSLPTSVLCPYLDEREGVCQIYDSRPIACRTYGFFIARDHNQYCEFIETEVNRRGDGAIVWGNAESVRHDLQQIGGLPVPFETHYRDRLAQTG
jgi:Fe-S-cluster containining protein